MLDTVLYMLDDTVKNMVIFCKMQEVFWRFKVPPQVVYSLETAVIILKPLGHAVYFYCDIDM